MLFLPLKQLVPLLFLVSFSSNIFGFGKNKVQYTNLTWSALESPHFSLHFHQDEEILHTVTPVWMESAYQSLQNQFKFSLKSRIPLIIYGNTSLFSQTNIITELLPEEVGGFTELFKNRIAIPFNGSYKDYRHVLHHELVHGFIFGMLTDQFGNNLLTSGNVQLPLWFMEGAAEFLSSGWDADADMFMIDRTLNSFIPPPGPALGGYMAYKGGQSFLYFLHESRGDSIFSKFLLEFKKSKAAESSIKKVYRLPLDDLGKEWIRELRRLYWPEIGCRIDPNRQAKPLTKHTETHDYYNLQPRISPDGTKIAFFSDRFDYTRILITDVKGKLLQSISQSGYGGFFESFHPSRSGLCWSPDGKKIAFVTSSGGSDEIRVVDIKQKKLYKKIRPREMSISNPDWSRDGGTIVFSGVDSGKCDLYICRLADDAVVKITNTIAAESDPHFSPNDKYIVFSIEDTIGSHPSEKTPWGRMPSELARYDRSTSKVSILTHTPWSESEPCYSPDGKQILFVSNRNGINNLYITPADSFEKARPLTNYTGGSSHPDWSSKNDLVAFTLFQDQGWDVWVLDHPAKKLLTDSLLPTRWVASFSDSTRRFFDKAELPPDTSDSTKSGKAAATVKKSGKPPSEDSTITIVAPEAKADKSKSTASNDSSGTKTAHQDSGTTAATIKDGTISITDTMKVTAPHPYKLSFSPDMVSAGVGIGTAYTPAGQMVIALSDLLGDHRIIAAGDLQGNFDEYAHLYGSYFYLKHRMDIGAGGFYSKDYALASVFGDKIYHQLQYGGFLGIQFPFSMYSRLDVSAFASHLEQQLLDKSDAPLRANTAAASLSYVYDDILWGITGPLNGLRTMTSITLSPAFPMIEEPYYSVESDTRHYLHLFKRFVWANRLFLGCSFPIDSDHSARRYLLGGNENWYPYRINSEKHQDNFPYALYSSLVTPLRGWSYVDFVGTKAALLNTEFRFPFIREITVVWPLAFQIQYIGGALFADVGNAWDEDGSKTLDLPSKLYTGCGYGMRANLGIFILRFDRGWPVNKESGSSAPINYFSMGVEF